MIFANKSKQEIAETVIRLTDYFCDPMIFEVSDSVRTARKNKLVVSSLYLYDIVDDEFMVDEVFNLNGVNFIFIMSKIYIVNDFPTWIYRAISLRNNINKTNVYEDILGRKFVIPDNTSSDQLVSSSVSFSSSITDSHTTFFPLFNSISPIKTNISKLITQL